MPGAIRFLFDYISPYSYLASTQVQALANRHQRTVEAVPILFAGLLESTGSRGPAEVPPRRAYMHVDVMRLGRLLGVPIEAPATHPFNPLAALRATWCVPDGGAEPSRWRLIEAFYRATWVRGLRIDRPEVVAAVATEAGFDGAALVEQSSAPKIKERLRTATQEAIALGAFGVPTMLVDGELFWGVDSLPLIERFLDGEKPFDAERLARWRALVPSAQRRGVT
jgi:2-hydroxychromene-2-carboxylate isomerase